MYHMPHGHLRSASATWTQLADHLLDTSCGVLKYISQFRLNTGLAMVIPILQSKGIHLLRWAAVYYSFLQFPKHLPSSVSSSALCLETVILSCYMQDVITALQEGSKNLHGSCGCLFLFSGIRLNENKVEKSACFVLVFSFGFFFFLIISVPACIIFQKLQYWIQLEVTAVLFCHSTKAFCLKVQLFRLHVSLEA